MKKVLNLVIVLLALIQTNIYAQTKYIGGSMSFNHSLANAGTGFQNISNQNTSLFLLPEVGIFKDDNTMFGINIGFNWSRERTSNNTNTLLAGVLGMRYRKTFGENRFQPMLETGITATIGQYNPSQQGAEYFNASIPLRGGVLFNLNEKWILTGSIDFFQLNYTRTGGLTAFNVNFWNRSGISVSVYRRMGPKTKRM